MFNCTSVCGVEMGNIKYRYSYLKPILEPIVAYEAARRYASKGTYKQMHLRQRNS